MKCRNLVDRCMEPATRARRVGRVCPPIGSHLLTLLGESPLPPLNFDLATAVFTASMAKRTGPGPFAAAPIVQGMWDGTGVPDVLSFIRGNVLHPADRMWYDNFDPYQGSIVFWITPEWDGDDGVIHFIYSTYITGPIAIWKRDDDILFITHDASTLAFVNVAAWNAGTTYCVVARWDSKNTLDGTNYGCVSVNNVHTYGGVDTWVPVVPQATEYIGSSGVDDPASSIVEGFTVYRRPLFDGIYGTAPTFDAAGPVDEIEEIYAAGAGADPCLITGSWDVVFCVPTDALPGALATGFGEAWSHPHASEVEEHAFLEDGYYGAEPWAVLFNGTTTSGNCGSGATLDDLADNAFTVGGWFRLDSYGEGITLCYALTKENAAQNQGWHLRFEGDDLEAGVRCATTSAISETNANELPPDGKWHYIAMFFDDAGDRKIYLAIDGRWQTYITQTAGVGAILSDAANDLYIGARVDGNFTFDGCLGFSAIWSDDHHTVGTDFIPSRTAPAAGGNLVESWHFDEGTGANAAAEVTSPANDCILTNATWEEQWEAESTPPEMTSLEFDGAATSVNCGSGLTIDDLHDAAMTAEVWIRRDTRGESNFSWILSKDGGGPVGWSFYTDSVNTLICIINCATADGVGRSVVGAIPADGKWHHVAMTWDDATYNFPALWIDGIQSSGSNTNRNGVIVSDAAANLHIGSRSDGLYTVDGAIGWSRISDVVRYTDTFVPPGRSNPPAVDGNTVAQYDGDGAGNQLTDSSGNANHGTITFGLGRWWNTPCMEWAAQGEREFQWGYALGSDGASDGATQIQAGLDAGENYVFRMPLRYGRSRRAHPRIQVYDNTNGAVITNFDGPFLHGIHDGGAAQADLSDTTAPYWPASLIGGTVYNVTDGSSATITAAGDSIAGGLAGGVDNLWDNADVYMIVPPDEDSWVWCEPFTLELPTIARNGAAADCVSVDLKLLNTLGEGVINWQQAEWLENLLDNPSLETGAGNPWIPDGWANADLDAGDTQIENATVHSGAASMEWNAGAVNEGITLVVVGVGDGSYFAIGGWEYGDTTGFLYIGVTGANGLLQYSIVDRYVTWPNDDVWKHAVGVERSLAANPTMNVGASAGGTGDRFLDDIYAILLDAVSLTATPASEANSQESGGVRVDGRDSCIQPVAPVGILLAQQGRVRWVWRPRHAAANLAAFDEFGNLAHLAYAEGVANYFGCWATAANNIRLELSDGGGVQNANWNCAGLIAVDTEYTMEIRYTGVGMQLYQDGVLRVETVGAIDFAADIPIIINWGHSGADAQQGDAVFIAP